MCSSGVFGYRDFVKLTSASRSLRPLVVALAPGQARSLGKLKVMREELSNELAVIINEYGPKLYEDFDQVGSPSQVSFESYLWDSGEFSCLLLLFHPRAASQACGVGRVVLVPSMLRATC